MEIWKLKSCKSTVQEGCWSLKVVPVLRVLMAPRESRILHHLFQIPDYQGVFNSLQVPSREPVGHYGKHSAEVKENLPSPLRAIWPWGSHSGPSQLIFLISKKRPHLHPVSVMIQYGQATYAPGLRLSPRHHHRDEASPVFAFFKGSCAFWGLGEDLGMLSCPQGAWGNSTLTKLLGFLRSSRLHHHSPGLWETDKPNTFIWLLFQHLTRLDFSLKTESLSLNV